MAVMDASEHKKRQLPGARCSGQHTATVSSQTPDFPKSPPHKRARVDDASKGARYVAPFDGHREGLVMQAHKRAIKRPGIPKATDLYDFAAPGRSSPRPPREKTKEGHFQYRLGDSIGSRFKILSLMGEGTFGRVLECWDRKTKETVAIKVIRSVPKYREAAMIELEVLSALSANDPSGTNPCIHLQQWFEYRGHVCMVFRKLGSSLFDFLRRNGYRPFPLDCVQLFARQLLSAIAFLHDLSIVHTDLKPENVLLVDSQYGKVEHGRGCKLGRRIPLSSDIRVIDLGSATFEDQYHSSIVSTRHYRAPEVILQLGWSYPCDVWSAGCIIVELLTGKALFQTHENLEHLAMMERVLDRIPVSIAANAGRDARRYFSDKSHRLLWPGDASRRSIRNVDRLLPLRKLLRNEGDASIQPYLEPLHGLLQGMLCFHPERRVAARACLEHEFFKETIRSLLPRSPGGNDSPSGAARSRDDGHAQDAQRGRSRSHARVHVRGSRSCDGGADAQRCGHAVEGESRRSAPARSGSEGPELRLSAERTSLGRGSVGRHVDLTGASEGGEAPPGELGPEGASGGGARRASFGSGAGTVREGGPLPVSGASAWAASPGGVVPVSGQAQAVL